MDKFNVYILKNIFKHLDERTLTIAVKVCKEWRNVIHDNKLVRRVDHTQLNDDVLENIFSYLNFRSLVVAEMVCKRWNEIIGDRRLYWQLTKKLCRASKRKLPKSINFDISNFNKERKKLFRAPKLKLPNKLSKHHFSRRRATWYEGFCFERYKRKQDCF